MEWIFGIVSALLAGLNIFQFIFWRSTKKEYEAKASQAQTEAKAAEQDYLINRVEQMERLYKQQGDLLDNLREKVLALTQEKINNETRIKQLEAENKTLGSKVERLEKELQAYKTINGKG